MANWNSYHENLIKNWSAMSKTYSIMHTISSEYYNSWDKRLGIPVILLGAITASSIFTTPSSPSEIWIYVNGGMVLLMTGISGISKFLGVSEKLTKHTAAAFKYTQISMDIDTLLSFPRKERQENPREFINMIKTSILEVREHAPDLPTWVVSSYINKLDKSLINTDTQINIKENSESKDEEKDSELEQMELIKYKNSEKSPVIKDSEQQVIINMEDEMYKIGDNKRQLQSISTKLESCTKI